jgi:hypothetical protein
MPEEIQVVEEVTIEHDVPEDLQGLTEEEVNQVIADSKLADLRARRTMLLEKTDWTQNADVPQATKDKWAEYRQALRDITITYSSLEGVDWPTPPV